MALRQVQVGIAKECVKDNFAALKIGQPVVVRGLGNLGALRIAADHKHGVRAGLEPGIDVGAEFS